MTPLIDGDVSRRSMRDTMPVSVGKVRRVDDPSACQMEGQVVDLKRRIPTLKRLIEDCDRPVAELDQEIGSEENRVKIHDPNAVAYSAFAKATTSRCDNLRSSANDLRAHLGKTEKTLRGLNLYFRLYAPS
jgi:hypothetical protein